MLIYLALLDDEQDKIKFADIYNTYNKQMWYAANEILKDKHLAEDAVHDAFLGIAKSFSKIKSRELSEVKAYVITAARHSALKYIKKAENIEAVDFQENYSFYDQSSEDNLKKIEAVLFATQIIEELPGIYSEVLYLHCVLELSEREIAQLLGISINAVRQRVHRGRKMFYSIMMKGEEVNDRKKV